MKIVVLGLSGAGKSTWARTLADRHWVPVLHLDRVHWLPGWGERTLEDERALVRGFMGSHDGWVIEGGYSNVEFERRLEEADQIFILLAPRLVRLWRVGCRWLRFRGDARPDMTEGCPEKIDVEFVKWILWKGTSPKKLAALRDVQKRYPHITKIYKWWRHKAPQQ